MACRPVYILILLLTIVVDYVAGIGIESVTGPRRKTLLLASLVTNLGVLCFFKYFNFLNDTFAALLAPLQLSNPIPALTILLPIGLSFHVFQSMSYTVEIYRGHQKAERHFGIFSLYVMFYPQLVAGPIERPQNILFQFRRVHRFDVARVVSGLELMLWGFFKKICIADRLAPFVNQVYDHPHSYHGISFWIATIFFAFEIYCDFSGYSDIALGSARVIGFDLMKNFNRPYFSLSVSEFWKRWHISLSTWFRDYLYIPMGGSRVPFARLCFNLLLTFLVSGLWHGASWTYVVWGGLNGFYLILELLLQRGWAKAAAGSRWERVTSTFPFRCLRLAYTFSLICLSWVFFRANTLGDAGYIFNHFFDGLRTLPHDMRSLPFLKEHVLLGQQKTEFLLALAFLMVLIAVDLTDMRFSVAQLLHALDRRWRWMLYYSILSALLFFGAFNASQQFIYFQF